MLSLPQSIYRLSVSSLKFYIVDTVHPTTFELVVYWAFPAYILNEIKPCNLDLIKQFTWITGIYCGECLRSDNAIRNHTNQILRYFDTVHSACPDPIDKDISYGLGFNFVSSPPVPIHGFQNLRPFLFRDVFNLSTVGLG